jgi:hypothetical protein
LWLEFCSHFRDRFISLQRAEVTPLRRSFMRPFGLHVQKLPHVRRSFVIDCRLHVRSLWSQLYTQAVGGAFCNIRCVCPIKLFSNHVTSDADPVLHASNYYAVQLSSLPLKLCLTYYKLLKTNYCFLLKRIQLTSIMWLESLNISSDRRGKTYRS